MCSIYNAPTSSYKICVQQQGLLQTTPVLKPLDVHETMQCLFVRVCRMFVPHIITSQLCTMYDIDILFISIPFVLFALFPLSLLLTIIRGHRAGSLIPSQHAVCALDLYCEKSSVLRCTYYSRQAVSRVHLIYYILLYILRKSPPHPS